ncbi:MAG: Acetyl-CoA decarbonylase/synthase complex subunit gamma [Euryarchaeota archaeon ADurb.BinA087]|nr:MAG: Acetyl-CoA decarbonylase/synthase complex subunit gamma [Euryarchaeota archaeon ADurb.BinA087]HNQ25480.1 mercury methylation corrinoid protein HgcA [Methanoregulaceae archaeon]
MSPNQIPAVMTTTSTLTFADRLDHFLARWGVNRMGHVVRPGLYQLGNPSPDSPVFVSANYTLSFDSLRSALSGIDAYLLVLDTRGINVWCAAGKGTFGTDELVKRIVNTRLVSVVRHRTVIVPQLGAPGISAHQVLQRSGFRVEYGPVRARDLPEYLKTRKAPAAMRRVEFPFRERIVLSPVELVHAALPTIGAAILMYLLAGPVASLAAVTAVLAGTVLFPALLPFLPTKDFSTKGLILGILVALPFAAYGASELSLPSWARLLAGIMPLFLIPPVVSYLALNFTGCTPYTSRSGVKAEIFTYVRVMVAMAGSGIILAILFGALWFLGVV